MGTDYDSNGFSQGDDGAIYGDPSDTGQISDYDSWDWKQIEAAIRGMSAGTDDSDNLDRAASVASPQSLQDAANVFYHVQVVLSGVAQALQDQAKALAGDDGPWKGDAADAFYDMMSTFSKQVAATADVLSGGKTADGGGGSGNSVPQQLADNSVNLLNAQNKIGEIDAWYANQATLMGVTPMSNGLIPVSKKPELVKMLNHDMRAVLKNLAADYQVTIDSVRPPGTITGPAATDPPPVDEPPADAPPDDYQPADYTPFDPADLSNSDGSGLDTLAPDAALTSAAGYDPAQDAMPSPYSGSLDTNGPGSGLGGDSDLSGLGGLGGLGPDGGLGTDNSTLDPNAFDRMLNPTAFSGGTGVDGNGGLGGDTGLGGDGTGLGGLPLANPSAFRGGTGLDGTGTLPESDLAEDPGTWKDGAGAADFPGDTGVGGTSGLGDGSGLGGLGDTKGLSPSAFPGSTTTGGSAPNAADLGLETDTPGFSPSAFPGSTGLSANGGGLTGGTGSGMPMMPGLGGGAQSGVGGLDRSDASGLLDGDAEPWSGDVGTAGEGFLPSGGVPVGAGGGLDLPGFEPSEFPGSSGLGGEGAGVVGGTGGGVPMMPGLGGGAQSGVGGLDRSDASGLLDGDAEPWSGDVGTAGEGFLPSGGVPVGADGGLDLPESEVAAFPGSSEVGGTGGGVPMMPGLGGGAQSGVGGVDRSDASGLLDPTAEPWTGADEPASGGDIVAAGAVPGGQEGLDLPGALAEEEEAAGQGGMPGTMMPGLGGAPGGAAGREEGTSSDASGLLAPSAEPWTEPGGPVGEVSGSTPAGTGAATLSGLPNGAEAGAGAAPVPAAAEGSEVTTEGFAVPAAAEAGTVPAATPFLPMGGMSVAGAPGRRDEDDHGTLVEPTGEAFAEPAPPEALAADALAAGVTAPAAPTAPAVPESPAYDGYDPSGGGELGDPLVVLRPADDDLSEEDTAAWGVAGASYVPLLWAARPEEEAEISAPGYATADEGTWGTSLGGAPRGADGAARAEGEDQPLATWRPNRPAANGESAVLAPAEQPLSCAPASADDEWDEEEPEGAQDESADEEPAARGIADLLVQEGDTWGSPPVADGPNGVF